MCSTERRFTLKNQTCEVSGLQVTLPGVLNLGVQADAPIEIQPGAPVKSSLA